MGDIKNLAGQEANKKIKELVEDIDICLFTTNLTRLPLAARPMSTAKVDENGTVWFLSDKGSDKNKDILMDDRVQLFYAGKNNVEYLSLFGTATILQDSTKAKELWSTIAKAWFEGPDDPNLTLIKVVPEDGYYWDTKSGKFVTLLKIATSVLTGKEMDGGIEGTIVHRH